MILLKIELLKLRLPDGRQIHCKDLSLAKGDTVALVAESGTGKSSLFLSLIGLLPTTFQREGTYFFDGNIYDFNRVEKPPIGMRLVLQGKHLLHPLKKLKNQIVGDKSEVLQNLKELGFSNPQRILNSYPNQLSGGQKQRFMVAEAVTSQHALILLDEPTFGLDNTNVELLIQFILKKEQAFFVITHDLDFAEKITERIYTFDETLVVPWQSKSAVTKQNVHQIPNAESMIILKDYQYKYKTRSVFQKTVFTLQVPTFELQKGVMVGIYGSSGSGKTTFLQALAGTLPGTTSLIKAAGYTFRYIYQDATSSFDPAMTFRESLEFLRLKPENYNLYLQKLGLSSDLLSKKPNEVSGGECQRLSICRALALGADILLMDEPLSAVDSARKTSILEILHRLLDEVSIIIVSHDLKTIKPYCHQWYQLENGILKVG